MTRPFVFFFPIYTRGKRLKTVEIHYTCATYTRWKKRNPMPSLCIHCFVTCHAKNLNLNLNHFKDFAIGYFPPFAVSLSCFNFAFDSWSKYGSRICAFSAFYVDYVCI